MKKISRRRFILLLAVGAVLVVLWIIGAFLPGWNTNPTSWLDYLLWPFLKVIWEPWPWIRKRTHWWQWRDYLGEIKEPLLVPGHPGLPDRSGFLAGFYYTNIGWQQVAIIKPTDYKGRWQIGFSAYQLSGTVTQLCTVLFNSQEEIAPLVGPYETTFFGFTSEGDPIKLEFIRNATKSTAGVPII